MMEATMANKFNRFNIQIFGSVDSNSTEEMLKKINEALGTIPNFKVKTVTHDMWINGYTGEARFFDENGKEVFDSLEPIETVVTE